MTQKEAVSQSEIAWAWAVNLAEEEAKASGNLLEAEVPGYGKFKDLKKEQLEEIASRMERVAEYYKKRGADKLRLANER